MKINIRGYITHKEAETYSDCADRYAVNIENNRFAISDGVSKSFFPDYWAEILVNSFISVEKDSVLSIKKCQSDWFNKVADKVNSPDVKWYTKNAFIKNESGLATLVTLRFENDKWFAEALGDSFLFFIKKDNTSFDNWVKLSSKPEPVVFDSFPDYYSSRNTQHGESKKIEQPLVEGTFYLMTDALSEWIFNQKEIAIEEIKEKWKSQDEFERCITELRALNSLNNDDSAILIIEVENDMKTEISYSEPTIQNLAELIEKEKLINVQSSEYKKESFIEDIKTEILANTNLDVQKEEPLKSKIEPNLSNAAKSKKKDLVKILKKLSRDDQKNILITLCKEYGVSFTN